MTEPNASPHTRPATVHRVVVTGLGALTPIGLSVGDFWEGMMAGRSGAAPITSFDASGLPTRFACELKGFDPLDHFEKKHARRLDPYARYALVAVKEALGHAALDPGALSEEELARIGVVFGTGIGGLQLFEEQTITFHEKGVRRISPFFVPMMISNMAAGLIAMEHKLRGPNHAVVSACATGGDAIANALLLLRLGHADAMLCGGAEAGISPLGIAGFSAMRALSTRNDDPATASRPFDKDRDGFVSGEGAGALVLETLEHATARGAEVLAEVAGVGMSSDAYHYAAPDPEGRGVTLAMRNALEDAGLQPMDVDYINMHATSTPVGDPLESDAIKAVFGEHAYRMSLSSTKSMTGHLLGGAGAIEAIASILAIGHGRIPPTINTQNLDEGCDLDYTLGQPKEREVDVALSNAFGFGGHNTTVVFRRFEG